MPFCEAYNERALRVMYLSQGYRLCFTSPPLLLKTPWALGGSDSQGLIEDLGNAKANIPVA